jgi:hypothetical protein
VHENSDRCNSAVISLNGFEVSPSIKVYEIVKKSNGKVAEQRHFAKSFVLSASPITVHCCWHCGGNMVDGAIKRCTSEPPVAFRSHPVPTIISE